jgi:hypothetical protein
MPSVSITSGIDNGDGTCSVRGGADPNANVTAQLFDDDDNPLCDPKPGTAGANNTWSATLTYESSENGLNASASVPGAPTAHIEIPPA